MLASGLPVNSPTRAPFPLCIAAPPAKGRPFAESAGRGHILTDSPNTPLRIAFSADHAGYELKTVLIAWLREQGHDVLDLGTDSDASVDYPDFGYRLANALERGDAPFGITICGSGI